MKKILTGFLLLLIYSQGNAQQVYSNEEWTNYSGNPDTINWTASKVTGSGDLVVVSNSKNIAGNTDVLITKFTSLGAIIWQQTFDGPTNGDDHGIKLVLGPSSEIYVIASIGVDEFNTDFGVLKYSSSGVLQWSDVWDGDGLYDLPSDLILDSTGDLFVVGSTSNATYFYTDYITLKYNSSGVLQWESYYDYANLGDGALYVSFKSSSLIVGGISNSTSNTTDAASLEINKSTGAIIDTSRTLIPGLTMFFPKAIATDEDMNIYITGNADNSGDYDIQTIKFDENLNILWIENYDGGDADDPKAIAVDDNGNIIIVGSQQRPSGISEYITIKYDNSGTLLWSRAYRADGTYTGSGATDVCVNPSGDIFVTGTVFETAGVLFNTVYYDTDGNIKHVMKQKGPGSYSNPRIVLDGGNLYVTGVRGAPIPSLTAVKYTFSERPTTAVTNGGISTHVANEIVMRFGRHAVLPAAINKKGMTFGELSEFVTAATIDSLEDAYPAMSWDRAKTYKVFLRMTMDDTLSISRNGHTVDVQPFWATLLINTGAYNEEDIIDSLYRDSVHIKGFPLLQYVHPNGIFEVQTDDTDFSLQHSLVSTTLPDAHINMQSAWDMETGNSSVKVGVYDTGVRWSHEDLGGGVGCNNCVVKGGWDYGTNSSITNTPNNGDPIGHGTQVAGIIGAIRNNDLGIAGIAGGDNDINKNGVSIHAFRAIGLGLSLTELCNALVEGTLNTTTGFGYGMHIMNNSWKRTVPYDEELPLVSSQNLFEDTQREIFRNQTVFVAGRGNQTDSTYYFPSYAKQAYWILNVGGSNTVGGKHGNSGYGGGVDFIAPHSDSLVYTINAATDNSYSNFSGTSSSTAHASGVASLMLSYINDQPSLPNNLAPDDVEFLMKRYASDRNSSTVPGSTYPIGYDAFTGAGLLNVGTILDNIDRDEYIIKHYTLDTIYEAVGEVLIGSNVFQDENMPYGNYTAEVYTTPYFFDNDLYPSDQIIDHWGLNSYSTSLVQQTFPNPAFAYIDKERGVYFNLLWANGMPVPMGDVVHLIEDPFGNPLDYWYPFAPGDRIRIGFSLHIKSDYVGLEENTDLPFQLSCYPNPTTDQLHLRFETNSNSDGDLTIYDVNGRVVHSRELSSLISGKHELDLDASIWTDGIYFVKLNVNNTTAHAKVIKH